MPHHFLFSEAMLYSEAQMGLVFAEKVRRPICRGMWKTGYRSLPDLRKISSGCEDVNSSDNAIWRWEASKLEVLKIGLRRVHRFLQVAFLPPRFDGAAAHTMSGFPPFVER